MKGKTVEDICAPKIKKLLKIGGLEIMLRTVFMEVANVLADDDPEVYYHLRSAYEKYKGRNNESHR